MNDNTVRCTELDELYDQFSYWLDDPEGQADGNGRNLAVFRFAHGLLKRALSDSFASVAMNIENLSSSDTRMKDIKLSSAPTTGAGSGAGSGCPSDQWIRSDQRFKQRSWSLVEHLGDERLALQLAKEMVERSEVAKEAANSCKTAHQEDADGATDGVKGSKSGGRNTRLACQLVSIVLEQSLAEVELELQVPRPRYSARCLSVTDRANSRLSPEPSKLANNQPTHPLPVHYQSVSLGGSTGPHDKSARYNFCQKGKKKSFGSTNAT